MQTKAFQKVFSNITRVTKATCTLQATGVGYEELALVNGRLAQVVKIQKDQITLQIFAGPKASPIMPRWYSWGGLRPSMSVTSWRGDFSMLMAIRSMAAPPSRRPARDRRSFGQSCAPASALRADCDRDCRH
jgi:hypothetical protein